MILAANDESSRLMKLMSARNSNDNWSMDNNALT